jgi:hypothetical protein
LVLLQQAARTYRRLDDAAEEAISKRGDHDAFESKLRASGMVIVTLAELMRDLLRLAGKH